jgi:hypothetical protein
MTVPRYIPIAQCAFCGDDALYKAPDGTLCCENCVAIYKPIFPRKKSREIRR